MKKCLDCLEVKPLSDFPPAKKRIDGRASYCRICMNTRSKHSHDAKMAALGRPVRPRRIAPAGQKWCPDCKAFKPLEDFPRNRSGRGGRGGYCKPCHNAKGKETYIRLYGSTREYHLQRRYGIGQVDVDRMLAEQDGACAVCKKPEPEHVDHDHETGIVRGLLCFNCNQALGNVRDSLAVLQSLRDYLMPSNMSAPAAVYQEYRLRGVEIEVAGEALRCA
jgi:recombination endonuclease VII